MRFGRLLLCGIHLFMISCQTKSAIRDSMEFGLSGDLMESLRDRKIVQQSSGDVAISSFADGPYEIQISRYLISDRYLRERIFSEKLAKLLSIYDSVRDPYFAVISKEIQCPMAYRPSLERFEDSRQGRHSFVRAYANDRNTWGACNSGDARKVALFHLISCQESIVQVEAFAPTGEVNSNIEQKIKSLQCFR